jgi:hypothetical protein
MSFIDLYESQLVDAGHRLNDRRPGNRPRRWLRVRRHRNVLVVLAVLLVGAPATAATIGWNPFDDPGRNPRAGTPTLSDTPPAAELVAILDPLRRPQTPADRAGFEGEPAEAFGTDVAGVKLDYIRLLDGRLELVPVDRFALGLERATRRDRSLPAFDPARFSDAVCLYVPGSDRTAGRPCYRAAQILSGHAVGDQAGTTTGIVPDGVARVRLVRGKRTSEVAVRDNLFVAKDPRGESLPVFLEWVDAHGRTIKHVDLMRGPATP